MENNLPLLNVAGKASLGCYAALPGSGPKGVFCTGCSRLTAQGSKFVCGQFQVLTGRAGRAISPNSAACRYFEQRPRFNRSEG